MSPLLFWMHFFYIQFIEVFFLITTISWILTNAFMYWHDHIAFILYFSLMWCIPFIDIWMLNHPCLWLALSTFHCLCQGQGSKPWLSLLAPPRSLVPFRCQCHSVPADARQYSLPGILGWWAPLLRVPESQPLALWGVGRVNGKPGWMGLCMSRAVTKPFRLHCCGWWPLWAKLHSSTKPHPSPGHCSPGLL